MIPAQLEKLRKDSRKLDNCIHRMKKKGRNDIASRLQIKKAHIDSCIESIIEEEVHPQHYEWISKPSYETHTYNFS
jgi:hypothetical protein